MTFFSLFLCGSCFSFFFFDFTFFFSQNISPFFSSRQSFSSVGLFSSVFFVGLFSSVFFPLLLWNLSERTQLPYSTVVEIRNFIFLKTLLPLLVFLSREERKRERERALLFFFSLRSKVVGMMRFTVTTAASLKKTNDLSMQNSSTVVGKRIGQKRGTFVSNENRNAKARTGSRGIPIKAAKRGGGSGTRPYTLRSGDTLESIASKRKLNVETLRNMNKKIGSGTPKIGQTILIPSGALSARDLEIINGIAKINAPRTYIPRKGETIGDVITARKIDFAEVQKLNPEVKLGTFSGKESLKLPAGKYTVREREMLQGCGILPQDAVSIKLPGAESARNILVATVLIGAYSMYFAACRRYQKYGTKLFGNDREEDNQD